jgi:hypothetical protein
MSKLALIAAGLGVFIMIVNLPAVLTPMLFRRVALSFPRSKLPGWLLLVFDLTWVSWVMLHAYFGRFEFLKPAIYAAAPIAFILMVIFMDELLAPRALGGLLLLIANPVLAAARWHESEWRLVLTVIAYVWVIVGMTLVLAPFWFRYLVEFSTRTKARCILLGLVRLAFGAFVLFLGLRIY